MEEKELNRIILELENCDQISIPSFFILGIDLEDISSNLYKSSFSNTVKKITTCGRAQINFSHQFLRFRYKPQYSKDKTEAAYERLHRTPDITSIRLVYEDNTEETFKVCFKGTDINKAQRLEATFDSIVLTIGNERYKAGEFYGQLQKWGISLIG